MAREVIQPRKEPGMVESMIPMAAGMVGSYFGGPAGGAAGGAVGQAAVNSGGQGGMVASNPRDRAMAKMGEDPVHQLQQGKAAAAKLDPETQKEVSPVLEEALKRAFEQRRSQTGAV